MPYKPFENQNCSVARATAVVGERWSLLIMREVLLGRRGFQEIKRNTGVASNILTDRLQTLVEHGLLRREVSTADDGAESIEYRPTRKGAEVVPILQALMTWGDRYEAGPNGPPRVIIHEHCEHPADPKMVCSHCGEDLHPDDIYTVAGPGATPRQRAAGRLPARS